MQKIIRYLSKEKFEWLLADKGIYVAPASKQNDEMEGIYNHQVVYAPLRDSQLPNIIDFEKLDDLAQAQMHHARNNSYLSSWYFGDDEKQSMWNEYASDGVLIVSSVLSLATQLPDPLGHASSLCKVTYDDATKANASNEPLNYKNLNWKDENEFRLIFDAHKYCLLTGYQKEYFSIPFSNDVPSYEDPEITSGISEKGLAQKLDVLYPKGSGHVLKFDLSKLIEEIRLHPQCPASEKSYFDKITRESGLEISIFPSHLERG
ncbi:hypothetical protein [Burkholderia stagnalis]|uniref:hypothetical protein n=1 Tax=Burkholderia stagnalis TaxID=1503054 RepID=UPI000A6D0477|nr:hypothetical protein [Burkholderia stagnalis]